MHTNFVKNRHTPMVTNGTFTTTSIISHHIETPNEEIVVSYQEQITTKTYLSPVKDNEFGTGLKSDIKLQLFIPQRKFSNSAAKFHNNDSIFDNKHTKTDDQ